MKKYMGLATIIFVSISLVFIPSCKRSAVADPLMDGPSGFEYILSGTANPSTLYVPQSLPEVSSQISVTVLHNGAPLVNGYVIFQNGGDHGYFEGYKLSDFKFTDSRGVANIKFIIPRGTAAIGDTFNDIKASLSTDQRLDNILSQVYDIIPIHIIPYDVTQMILISGSVYFNDGTPIPGVVIEVSNNGGIAITQASGSYRIYVCWGWTGSITPNLEGYTFVPSQYTYSVAQYSDLPGRNFVGSLSTSPTIQASPTSISTDTNGGTFNIYVSSSLSSIQLSYDASASAGWITITNGIGTTPNTISISIGAWVSPGSTRSGTITITGVDNQGNASSVTVTVNQTGD